jgi:hypothetical protein
VSDTNAGLRPIGLIASWVPALLAFRAVSTILPLCRNTDTISQGRSTLLGNYLLPLANLHWRNLAGQMLLLPMKKSILEKCISYASLRKTQGETRE